MANCDSQLISPNSIFYFILAQAMYEGDTKLIEELYPDFPRSEPIYAGTYLSLFRKSKDNFSFLLDFNQTKRFHLSGL